MTFNEISKDLAKRLSPKRYRHVLGVVEAAEELAKVYEVDIKKARLAALLHDCAKEEELDAMQAIVKVAGLVLDQDMLASGALLHGEAGAVLAKTRYGVDDPTICEAIRVHTVGKPHMSDLDKVIFLGVEILRQKARENLNQGVLAGYDMTIRHLLDKGLCIYEPTIVGRNALLKEIKSING